jgi:hypothetical protein
MAYSKVHIGKFAGGNKKNRGKLVGAASFRNFNEGLPKYVSKCLFVILHTSLMTDRTHINSKHC